MQQKTKIEMQTSIIIEDTITIKSKSISVWALLDTNAEANVISQHFMMQIKMKSLNSELPCSVLLNEQHHYCYDTYLVTYQLKDSWDQMHNCEHIFYALDKNGSKLILDLSALEKKQIKIDCEMWEWHFRIKLQSLSLKESSEDFEQSLKKESMICALLWAQPASVSVHLQDIELTLTISVSYSDYADVFLKKEASWLSAHEKHDHAIKTNGEEPLHEPLYNLSETELNILRKYLDDVLVKGWIKHSVSSADAPVLFTSKKDEDLRLCVNYTAPQPDQLSKFWIEKIVHLIHFYKSSTQLIFITITCGGEPQLLFSENFSCSFTKNATKPLWPSTSQQLMCFQKIWISRKFHLAFI